MIKVRSVQKVQRMHNLFVSNTNHQTLTESRTHRDCHSKWSLPNSTEHVLLNIWNHERPQIAPISLSQMDLDLGVVVHLHPLPASAQGVASSVGVPCPLLYKKWTIGLIEYEELQAA